MLIERKSSKSSSKFMITCMIVIFSVLLLFFFSILDGDVEAQPIKIHTDKVQYALDDYVYVSVANNIDQHNYLTVQTPSGEIFSKHFVSYSNNVVPDKFKLDKHYLLKCDCNVFGAWSIKLYDYEDNEILTHNFFVLED